MSLWAPLALTTVTAGLMGVPVIPALLELKRQRDSAPLPTSRHDGRARNFATTLQARLEPVLAQLQECRLNHELKRTQLNGEVVLLAGRDRFTFDPSELRGVSVIAFGSSVSVPTGAVVECDLYTEGDLHIGEGAVVRAALATGHVHLERKSAVLRWLHGKQVHLSEGSASYGRVSADDCIFLAAGSSFERVHAPVIRTVDIEQLDFTVQDAVPASDRSPRCAPARGTYQQPSDESRQRIRARGDFVLPARTTLNASVVTKGSFQLGSGAQFFGSVKSYDDATLEQDSSVHGSVVCSKAIHVGDNAFLCGPVIAEGDILIASGARFGKPDAPTTVSCNRLQVETGSLFHGTIWARAHGSVTK